MTKNSEEKKYHQIVEFRCGIFAELANPFLVQGELQKLIAHVPGQAQGKKPGGFRSTPYSLGWQPVLTLGTPSAP